MSKKIAVNQFTKGLVTDLHELSVPNNVLTDALNATLVTGDGDEMTLQNDTGNQTIEYNGKFAQLTEGFIPIGMKEYGGVIYIASYCPNNVYKKTKVITLQESSENNYGSRSIPLYIYYVKNGDTEIPVIKQYDIDNSGEIKKDDLGNNIYWFVNITNIKTENGYTTFQLGTTKYNETELITLYEKGLCELGSFPSPNYYSINNDKVGDMEWNYKPLHNLTKEVNGEIKNLDFRTNLLNFDSNHPVNIETQKSYDNSINLILNDDKNIPRLINSGFVVKQNNKFQIIDRTGTTSSKVGSNKYRLDYFDLDTSLNKRINSIPIVNFNGVLNNGDLKVGNYVFYFKYSDADGNETDFIAESGIVSCFKGNNADPFSIDGGFRNSNSGKCVQFTLTNIDTAYNNIIVYYSRSTSDIDQNRVVEVKRIDKNYHIIEDECKIIINGSEITEELTIDQLNEQYTILNSVKSNAQTQNMLFSANVRTRKIDNQILNDCALKMYPYLNVHNADSFIGTVDEKDYSVSTSNYQDVEGTKGRYYNVFNIYNRVGYWNGEIYRLGVVYIFEDNTLSPVYNIRGKRSIPLVSDTQNYTKAGIGYTLDDNIQWDGDYCNKNTLENKRGVISIDAEISGSFQVNGIQIQIDKSTCQILKNSGVRGLFFVRQKRLPTILGQAYLMPIDVNSKLPLIFRRRNEDFNMLYSDGVRRNLFFRSNMDSGNTLTRSVYDFKSLQYNVVGESFLFFGGIGGNPVTEFYFKTKEKDTSSGNEIYLRFPFKGTYTAGDSDNDKDFREMADYEGRLFYFPPFKYGLTNTPTGITINNFDNKLRDYYTSKKQYCGICPDFYIKQSYYNQFFTGTQFVIDSMTPQPTTPYLIQGSHTYNRYRQYYVESYTRPSLATTNKAYIVSITDSMPVAATNNSRQDIYKTLAGNESEAFRVEYFYNDVRDDYSGGANQWYQGDYMRDRDLFNTAPFVRGKYSPYLGIKTENENIKVGSIINIYIPNYNASKIEEYFNIRMSDTSAYYPITDRLELSKPKLSIASSHYLFNSDSDTVSRIECFRGDCYISTFTERINRNFQDPSAPNNDKVVDNLTWNSHYKPNDTKIDNGKTQLEYINLGDVNAVKLGSWVTFTCYTNYNLSIRSLDESHVGENGTTGNARGFYPLQAMNVSGSFKIPESQSMNDGFNSTTGERYFFIQPDVPFIKNEFKNRIYYSDVAQEDAFKNGYRVNQSSHYRDYNTELGYITKILPYVSNMGRVSIPGILVIFEHGVAFAPVNEKQLASSAGDVFINSHNVLPQTLSVISDMYGSQWADSVIKTPYGVYGIDTVAKKIWKLSTKGFSVLSDFTMEHFLNQNIDITERDSQVSLGIRNVKTHYNESKNDVMFTFINSKSVDLNNTYSIPFTKWNLCYNEISSCFTTFYSWIPSYSENIDNVFFSLDENYTRHMILKEEMYDTHQITYIVDNVKKYANVFNWVNENEFSGYIWKHGTNGKFQQASYIKNKALPTNWYGEQHPFEFEFEVLMDSSIHKIFENLQIISNDAEPESFHFEVTGDSYNFDKVNMYYRQEATKEMWQKMGSQIKYDSDYTTLGSQLDEQKKSTVFPLYYNREYLKQHIYPLPNEMQDYINFDINPLLYPASNTTNYPNYDVLHKKTRDYVNLSGSELLWDKRTNEISIVTHIKCSPINKVSRLRGNSQYKYDRWNVQIPSITYMQKNEEPWVYPPIVLQSIPTDILTNSISAQTLPNTYDIGQVDTNKWTYRKETKIRDKYCKIRIRYNGTKQAIIQAIRTLYTEVQ